MTEKDPDPGPGQEPREPAITVRMGLERDPVYWILPAMQIGALVCLGLLLLSSGPCCLPVAGLLCGFVAIQRLRKLLQVDRSVVSFFDDEIDIDLRQSGGRRRIHGYRDLSHVELASLSMVRLTVQDATSFPHTVVLRTRAGQAEDLFDSILDLIDAAAPGHLYSIFEDGQVRYSTDCDLAEVYARHRQPVDRVEIRWVGRRQHITAGTHEFEMDWPLVRDTRGPCLRLTRDHVLTGGGMVIGTARPGRYQEVILHLCSDEEFILSAEGDIHLGDEKVGRASPGKLELDRPLPAIVAVVVLVTFITGRYHKRL